MKRKPTKKTYKIPLYTGRLNILMTSDFKEVRDLAKLPKDFHSGFELGEDFSAITFQHPNTKDTYICLSLDTEYYMIAHECVHVVNYIFDEHWIRLDIHNDEPYAYLLGWVFKKASEAFDDWKQ